MPGIRGSSGTVDRNLSSAALNASGFPVMSRRDLGRVLNKRGPRIAKKEFSRVFLTDGGDFEDVLGIIHSRPRRACDLETIGVESRFGTCSGLVSCRTLQNGVQAPNFSELLL